MQTRQWTSVPERLGTSVPERLGLRSFLLAGYLALPLVCSTVPSVRADEPKALPAEPAAKQAVPAETTSIEAIPTESKPAESAPATADPGKLGKDPPGLKRLAPNNPVWLDTKRKRIVIVGEVCLREGQLEMFACLKGTKEHESIIAIETKAYIVHAGLLAAGAEAGSPAQYVPKYAPARGTEIEVALFWTDAKGKRQRAFAQDWIRNVKTGKAMTQPWVFGGSGFWTDEQTGEKHYLAEGGDLICVSNFASATLDLPIQSSSSSADLLFDAFTERIPPQGTKVTVVLTPKKKAKDAKDGKKKEAQPEGIGNRRACARITTTIRIGGRASRLHLRRYFWRAGRPPNARIVRAILTGLEPRPRGR